MPEELWTEVHDIVQGTGIKAIPMEKKCKKAKWLSGEALQKAVKRIHGYFDEWMTSLNESGFDFNNKDHILVVLGDIFDRGRQPKDVYKFLVISLIF